MNREEERLAKWRAALAECPPAGAGVHRWIQRAANAGVWANVEPAAIESEIRAAMTRPPQGREVAAAIDAALRGRAAWVGGAATAYTGGVAVGLAPKHKPLPANDTRRRIVARGAGAGFAELWEASPVRIDWGEEFWRDAVALLHALFRPGELVFCGGEYDKGKANVRTREEWCERWEAGEPLPEKLCLNPIKEEGGRTKAGAQSWRCDSAVAAYRNALAEMDSAPLEEQIAFWHGLGLARVNAQAVTFSGGKSLHVILRVDAGSKAEWDSKVKGQLFPMLESVGCDGVCSNPARLSRLAGASRKDKGGTVQRLWYVGEELK